MGVHLHGISEDSFLEILDSHPSIDGNNLWYLMYLMM